jgi:hypothetical protein
MSLIPTIYSSDDPGAPTLTGQAGSLAVLLDAILVDGYGSGSTAKAGLGWTRAFTGTNLRAFRNNIVSGLGYYVRLDDTQTRVGRLRTYIAMTAISTGTGMAPLAAQRTNGALWLKSDTADATARKWWAIGNEQCFYLFIVPVGGDVTSVFDLTPAVPYFAGRMVSRKPGDQFAFGLALGVNTYAAGAYSGDLSNLFRNYVSSVAWNAGVYTGSVEYLSFVFSRGHAQTGNAVAARVAPDMPANTSSWGGNDSNPVPYPDPVSGGMLISKPPVIEGINLARAYFPGLYVPSHYKPLVDLQVETNIPGLASGTKLLAKTWAYSPTATIAGGQVLFDITNPW